eukprot:3070943-Pyramimonas_sp.AAC.1
MEQLDVIATDMHVHWQVWEGGCRLLNARLLHSCHQVRRREEIVDATTRHRLSACGRGWSPKHTSKPV